jgi:hypothetical protein
MREKKKKKTLPFSVHQTLWRIHQYLQRPVQPPAQLCVPSEPPRDSTSTISMYDESCLLITTLKCAFYLERVHQFCLQSGLL